MLGLAAAAGLFGLWNLQTSVRIAYESARWLNGGGYPVFAHALGTLFLMMSVTGVLIIQAGAQGQPRPWFMVVVTVGAFVVHGVAIDGAHRLGDARRKRSESAV
ncbi:hypothetical protein [Nannocystis radixulma]|uniref:Uncharacterized protein n=1 Tax=Nannocystis radixulma TaxID=2995305 RepID=A0ABT5BBU2_9BACT|nr:hypothetical protein [Nannocystis radixulma]MDC0671596.1 hypothetical protein [Nannocystis radixulma]